MKFQPLHDLVLIRRDAAATTTLAGIILIENKPVLGEVVAVGPGAYDTQGVRKPLGVKVGEHVLYGKLAGTEVEIEGEKLLILREADITGVID